MPEPLNFRTGKLLWHAETGRGYTVTAVADGVVYASPGYGLLHALDAKAGTTLWSEDVGGDARPVPVDGVVYTISDYGPIVALSAADGEPLWSFDQNMEDVLPITLAVIDGVAYIGTIYQGNYLDGPVFALDAITGEHIWQSEVRGSGGSLAVADGVVYIGSVTWDENSYGRGYVHALDGANGEHLWSSQVLSVEKTLHLTDMGVPIAHLQGFPSALTVVDGVVYTGSLGVGGKLYALDAATGNEVWNSYTASGRSTQPMVTGGVVYIDSLSGPLYAIDASTGEQLWTSSSGEPPPTVVDAVVYLDRSYYTYVLDTSAGEERRTTYTWGISFRSTVVQDGVVYIPVDYGQVFGDVLVLDASTGELRWRYLMDRPPSHLGVVGGIVYVSLDNGDVYALDAEISVPPEESAPLVSSSEPPLRSCYDGLLSGEPMHCYLLEQAEVAGLIDVDVIYNGGGNLYIYIRQAERPSPETAAFFRERAIEFYLQWPSVAPRDTTKYWECWGTYEWCLLESWLYPFSEPSSLRDLPWPNGFRNAEILAGGAEARRSRPGWASWEQLWPKVDVYEPSPGDAGEASFDVSDVDVTSFPSPRRIDCSTWGSVCRLWKRYPESGFAGWKVAPDPEEDSTYRIYLQVKLPPEDEEQLRTLKEELASGHYSDLEVVEIPVKYDFGDLWRWATILNRFSTSAGNTVGILGANIADNYANPNRDVVWPTERVQPVDDPFNPTHENRTILVVNAYDPQMVADALPVLLPQLGIPTDAIGLIVSWASLERAKGPVVAVPE